MMKALVFGGPGRRAWQAMPKPVVRDPEDAVVRITTSTICGTDLHIMKGDVPGRRSRRPPPGSSLRGSSDGREIEYVRFDVEHVEFDLAHP